METEQDGPHDTVASSGPTWDPEKALSQLAETQANIRARNGGREVNEAVIAEATVRRALPLAAEVLYDIMMYSPNERLRMDAAKQILDRGLGKVGEEGLIQGDKNKSPWEHFMDQCVTEVTLDEQTGQAVNARGEVLEAGYVEIRHIGAGSNSGENETNRPVRTDIDTDTSL